MYQDIFKDTKNKEIPIHYLRQLMLEKCIVYALGSLYTGLNNGKPTSLTIDPYLDQSINNRPLGVQRGMLWFSVSFKCQLSDLDI